MLIAEIKSRIDRARMALVWAERQYLLTKSQADYETLLDAQMEKHKILRIVKTLQTLVSVE